MLLLRKITFYVFVLLYLFFCPLLILQALGYFVKPHSQGAVVETGIISLVTVPSGATVYVENKKYIQKTPMVLRELLPGEYRLKLLLKNYRPWNAAIAVKPGKAAVFDKIILIPQAIRAQEIFSGECEELIGVPGTRYFLVSKGFKLSEWYVGDAEEKRLVPLVRPISPFKNFTLVSCITVERSPFVLLETLDPQGQDRFLWAELRKDQAYLKDITSFFAKKPEQVEWDPADPKYLFVFGGGKVSRINLQSRTLLSGFLEGVKGYGLGERMVYYLTNERVLERIDSQKRYKTGLRLRAGEKSSVFDRPGLFRIKPLSRDVLVFLGPRGEFLVGGTPHHFLPSGVQGIAYDLSKRRLLIWHKERIGILDFSREKNRENIFIRPARLQWRYDQGKDIGQAFWSYDGSHILFRDRDKIFLLELDPAATGMPEHLLTVRRKSSIVYHEETGRLFYLAEAGGTLNCFQLIPQSEMLKFYFPEKRGEPVVSPGSPGRTPAAAGPRPAASAASAKPQPSASPRGERDGPGNESGVSREPSVSSKSEPSGLSGSSSGDLP